MLKLEIAFLDKLKKNELDYYDEYTLTINGDTGAWAANVLEQMQSMQYRNSQLVHVPITIDYGAIQNISSQQQMNQSAYQQAQSFYGINNTRYQQWSNSGYNTVVNLTTDDEAIDDYND